MTDYNELKENMKEIGKIVERIQEDKFITLYRFLRERIDNPDTFVVFLGETSSGKTTLLNGLMEKEFLKTSSRPTTGTVIEVKDDKDTDCVHYHAINKDASWEPITEVMFHSLSKSPDSNLERLRLVVPGLPHELENLRLFDTPGYGSLHEEHEEVLKNFLPNSDVIIYVVSYRIGFKQDDHHFMQFVREVIHEDIDFFLVINRAPQGVTSECSRVKEIVQHAEDSLHRKLPYYIVQTEGQSQEERKPILPKAMSLWLDLKGSLVSEKRQKNLIESFLKYQESLLLEMKVDEEKKLANMKASEEEKAEYIKSVDELLEAEQRAKKKMIEVFGRLYPKLDKLFSNSRTSIFNQIEKDVNEANKWTSKDEYTGFIQHHLLPLQVKNETREIATFLQAELERLDEEINSMLNTAIEKFETQVELKAKVFKSYVFNLGNKMAKKAVGYVLTNFFKQYGGAGGAGAGVANAAKKGLKKLGDLVGKKFSRDTHNALAQFIKRIGATSSRAITAAAAVIVEGVFYVYDSLTWQEDLKKEVNKALEAWETESSQKVKEDLKDLEAHNLEKLTELFDDFRESKKAMESEIDQDVDLEQIEENLIEIENIIQKINVMIKGDRHD